MEDKKTSLVKSAIPGIADVAAVNRLGKRVSILRALGFAEPEAKAAHELTLHSHHSKQNILYRSRVARHYQRYISQDAVTRYSMFRHRLSEEVATRSKYTECIIHKDKQSISDLIILPTELMGIKKRDKAIQRFLELINAGKDAIDSRSFHLTANIMRKCRIDLNRGTEDAQFAEIVYTLVVLDGKSYIFNDWCHVVHRII